MTHRTGIITAMLCLALASAGAAVAAGPKTAGAKTTRSARVAPATKPSTPPREAPRTLDAIRIEGEIDVPQVLFITARDYRRFRDGNAQRYQPTAADIARSITMPTRLRMVAPSE